MKISNELNKTTIKLFKKIWIYNFKKIHLYGGKANQNESEKFTSVLSSKNFEAERSEAKNFLWSFLF